MPKFSNTVIRLFKRVSEQGGLLSGQDPTAVNLEDPIRLWIIQVGIIVCTASLLSLPLRKLRQPKVIAEVLGGIILGPTAFGRIPGFTQHIFPEESKPFLDLVATIGLCLFLFLVGLEIDIGVIKRNAKLSAAVALAGMALPFGFGAALSVPIYSRFIDQNVEFTHFMLFTGVAYSITAFPVLCRILTELKLLDTTVGIIVLSAGVGNDIVGWTLLALSVALVNAGSGLTALYILLTCVAFAVFLLIPGKVAFRWLARVTGSIENGPSVMFMTLTVMVMLGSSFFTDIIGVHPIFGAFLTGLIVPREGGLTIALTEKLEDMVTIIFLPLYFTISGLSTDLGQLNNGVTWGFTIAIMALAFTGKFGGCTLAAHYAARFNWRESATIGSLMSCKGLVELIVLNVGLQADILSTRVFSMFVLEALVLTFMTTPLVTVLYPPEYRTRIARPGVNTNKASGDPESGGQKSKKGRVGKREKQSSSRTRPSESEKYGKEERTRFTVVLDRIEHLPGAMAIAQLLNPLIQGFDDDRDLDYDMDTKETKEKASTLKLNSIHLQSPTPSTESLSDASISSNSDSWPSPIINALRLIKLTDRVSAVMKSHDIPALLNTDPLLNIYRMFALLQGINVTGDLEVVPEEGMVNSTLEKAEAFDAEVIVVPWALNVTNNVFAGDTWQGPTQEQPNTPKSGLTHNPFETLFSMSLTKEGNSEAVPVSRAASSAPRPHGHWSFTSNSSISHSHFIRSIFARSDVDVGLYIDQSGPIATSTNEGDIGRMNVALGLRGGKGRGRIHVFLPFFGGPDDRLALEFVVGLCRRNERLSATVVRLRKVENTAIGTTMVEGTLPGGDKISGDKNEETNMFTVTSNINNFPDTVYCQPNTEVRLQSETADNIVWAKYATPATSTPSTSSTTTPNMEPTVALPTRVTFKEITHDKPLHAALNEAYGLQGNNSKTRHTAGAGAGVLIVTGRSRRLAVESHKAEIKELMLADGMGSNGEVVDSSAVREVKKTVGEVGSAFVGKGVGVGVWVLQAALDGER
ncbi:hypothetical protein AGABI2DRAFT_186795 [Agaricus bisporus var. bisporus H97]|uniref:hypothetical protein n=1 Tax=Agaricus bisporus var. bisporus (strain H97 / ATCC MYA-4626 / FGSC 10389) TaxID=936046 RepID=UPI00029F5812|nr:hypothetical protein AGABI2DRAFT_186795 [Agaricus bisporus var. bisporus H97]EKV46179.1 hypothetical protein AGABI2DRAFT_186795 [Agaricus bisporus var. bisporus H97]